MTNMMHQKTLCYFLSYYFPEYIRTKTLMDALGSLDFIRLIKIINHSKGIIRYLESVYKLIKIKKTIDPDVYCIGFRGHELYWVIRMIVGKKTIIFDQMMSPYDSLLNERKMIKKGSLLEKIIYLYEKSILNNADMVLTDTIAHQQYFSKLFHINGKKIIPIPVSADEHLFNSNNIPKEIQIPINKDFFKVFFYGSFLPLHGIDIILKAASRLVQYKKIVFILIGGKGTSLNIFNSMINDLKLPNVYHKTWVDYHQLPLWIADADICLGGPFGNTGQSQRIITGKTFQFLCMKKPTVIGKVPFETEFEDKKNCLIVNQGNPDELANAILWAYQHPTDIQHIGLKGYELYNHKFSHRYVKKNIQEVLESHVLFSKISI